MAIEQTPLPYDRTALEPHVSAETIDLQHGRHQKHLLDRVNAAVLGTALAESPLDDIVRKAQGTLFNHAAQAWNDVFYWAGLKPAAGGGGGEPKGKLNEAIARSFGGLPQFQQAFAATAERLFGSGWVWLVQRADGALAIVSTPNAATPLTGDDAPLLACCLWEHAYAIDHGDARAKYLDAFWHIVHWDAVAARMK